MVQEAMSFAAQVFDGAGGGLLLFPSAALPLNNALFTAFRHDRRVDAAMFDDGISTYLNSEISIARRVKWAVQWFKGAAGLAPRMTIPRGHPQGREMPEIGRVYVAAFDALPTAIEKAHPIRLQSCVGERNPEIGVFLLQPYSGKYRQAFTNTLRAIAANRGQFGVKKWYFKAHHFSRPDECALLGDLGFDAFESALPLEEALLKSDLGVVLGINSTALFTVKMLFGGDIRSIAIAPNKFIPAGERRDPAELNRLFSRVGVELWDVDDSGRLQPS